MQSVSRSRQSHCECRPEAADDRRGLIRRQAVERDQRQRLPIARRQRLPGAAEIETGVALGAGGRTHHVDELGNANVEESAAGTATVLVGDHIPSDSEQPRSRIGRHVGEPPPGRKKDSGCHILCFGRIDAAFGEPHQIGVGVRESRRNRSSPFGGTAGIGFIGRESGLMVTTYTCPAMDPLSHSQPQNVSPRSEHEDSQFGTVGPSSAPSVTDRTAAVTPVSSFTMRVIT